jgi:hypothetical protein
MNVMWSADTCALNSCGHFHEFTVEHPYRGTIDVCAYHARQMRDTFDDVEVTL